MNTSEYLDLAMKKAEMRSDNELARALNWSKSQVNNYRHNRQAMDNNAAMQIAEMLEIPVWCAIADMESIRAEKKGDRTLERKWSKLAKLTKQTGLATANLLINMALFVPVAVYCILCKIADTPERAICEVSPSFKYC